MPHMYVALQVVREKLFQRLREEVPYGVQLEPEAFNVLRDGNYHIEQTVVVPTKHVRLALRLLLLTLHVQT